MSDASSRQRSALSVEIDTTKPHPGRMYDYLLGGRANFEVDREAVRLHSPSVGGIEISKAMVRANRAFLVRAVRYLAEEAGVRQFLDLGTGIPTEPNVADIARRADPECRVVYVDNDSVMMAHAHELLKGTRAGAVKYIWADLRDPAAVLEQASETLDLSKPVAVLLVSITHFLPGDEPLSVIGRLSERVCPGSYLVVSQLTSDIMVEAMAALAQSLEKDDSITQPFVLRDRDEFARFFDGWQLVEPGVVPLDDWRPDGEAPSRPPGWDTPYYAAIGHKPRR